MKIRAITVGIEPDLPLVSEKIVAAGRFAARVRAACADVGVMVQTIRLATPPFPSYLGRCGEAEILRFAIELEQCCRENGIDYCSLGPVKAETASEYRFFAFLPQLIAQTESVFTSAVLGAGGRAPRVASARAIAQVMREIA